jgi:hypothetical protein
MRLKWLTFCCFFLLNHVTRSHALHYESNKDICENSHTDFIFNILIYNKMNIILPISIIVSGIMLLHCRPVANEVNIQNDRFKEEYSAKIALNNPSTLVQRFECPSNYTRNQVHNTSFEAWLRNSALTDVGTPVRLFDNTLKHNQHIHAAVLTFDVGNTDLQQCADAVMRLRAEYLFQKNAYDSIVFTFTNGTKAPYSKWRDGYRTNVAGNTVEWVKRAARDTSYACFRNYLNTVFMYCGTYSLSKELKTVSIQNIKGGDVFIHGGFPGHAMIVMDVATHVTTKKKIFMLAQSYMPAQDIHIVKNLSNMGISPWYEIPENGILKTPEWTFGVGDLKRF